VLGVNEKSKQNFSRKVSREDRKDNKKVRLNEYDVNVWIAFNFLRVSFNYWPSCTR